MSAGRSIQAITATLHLLLLLAVATCGVSAICWSCLPENLTDDEIDRILAEDFKKRVLETMGLTTEPVLPPNLNQPPQELLEEMYPQESDNMDDVESNLESETVLLKPRNNDTSVGENISFFEYIMKDKIDGYRVEHASLWLHLDKATEHYDVYEKISNLPRRLIYALKYSRETDGKWRKLIFQPSEIWRDHPWRKMRIELEGVKTPVVEKPFLQVSLKKKSKRIQKRSQSSDTTTLDCLPSDKSLCCKHKRTIQIAKVWTWVVYPKVYQAFTCSGTCTPLHRNNHTWTHVSQQANPPRAPCCVPTAFTAVNVLTPSKDGTGFENRLIKDLQVSKCGCS